MVEEELTGAAAVVVELVDDRVQQVPEQVVGMTSAVVRKFCQQFADKSFAVARVVRVEPECWLVGIVAMAEIFDQHVRVHAAGMLRSVRSESF